MSFVQPILAQLLEQAQPFIEQLTVHADNAGVFTALAQARAVKDDVIASAVATGDRAGLFSPWFWMPEGVSWEDIKNYRLQGHLVPQLSDLNEIGVYIIYFALLRFVLEATLFRLLARIFLKHRPKELRSKAPHAQVLAKYELAPKGKVEAKDVEALAKSTGVKAPRIAAWINEIREADELARNYKKWTETCWRLFFLAFLSIYEYGNVWNKSWMWNPTEQWENYPFQPVDPEVRLLYLMQVAVYVNLMISQFFDVKRKDFLAMFIHHIATIILIGYSYAVNFVRNGILVLMCHDPCDVFMELAKLCKYAGFQSFADVLFGGFVMSWMSLRLVILPFFVIHSWVMLVPFAPFPSWYFMTGLLGVLQVLHVYWFFMIMRIVYNKLVLNKEVSDEREEDVDAGGSATSGKKNQ